MAKTILHNTRHRRIIIREMRASGAKVKEVAARFHVAPATMSAFISAHIPEAIGKTHPKKVFSRERAIRTMLAAGTPVPAIAAAVGVVPNTVYRMVRRRLRMFSRLSRTLARRRRIAELAHQRKSVTEICCVLKISRGTVHNHLKALHLTVPRYGTVTLMSHDIEPLLKEGKPVSEIAAHFKVGCTSIRRIINQYLPEYTRAGQQKAREATLRALWEADVPPAEAQARSGLKEAAVRKYYQQFARTINAPTPKSERDALVVAVGAALAVGHAQCKIARDLNKHRATIRRVIRDHYPEHLDLELSNAIAIGYHRKRRVLDPALLAERTGLALSQVQTMLRRAARGGKESPWTVRKRHRAVRLLKTGMPVTAVAKTVGRTEAWVQRVSEALA